ncbi:M23 family metallopeptidase [Alkalinema sp. FACHB-956]|uniref:M23 family metallopeptidase n=1 Tax=Alkalinema sp. FACHB-956 TaxID=2692768 RepID=UPI00168408A7|nr:M23 family metallopeptidase [Alkalinema sp. FACHB-956]MBD2325600.1 M23 family metallopeptidase [Alkalinema sp. FACHB-956]
MTQRPPMNPSPSCNGRTSLIRTIGFCLGSLSMLGSTVAQAQTSDPLKLLISEKAPTELAASGGDRAINPASTKPDDLPIELELPEPSPQVSLAPSSASPASPDMGAAPLPDEPAPVARETAPPVEIVPSPVETAPSQPNEAPYIAPDAIIFSERSSGCEQAVKWGKTAGSVCGGANVASGSQGAGRSTSGKAAIGAQGPATYAVATPETMSAAPVRLGPVSFGSAGVQFTPPSLKPYFNSAIKLSKLTPIRNLGLIFPLAIPAEITSIFGWRIHPITGDQRMHTGTDIGAPMGTPVLAALTGRVLLADLLGGYGLTVALEHNNGTQQTLYAHLSELFVKPGEVIQKGTVIGLVGSTGNSTGPHLHFELRQQTEDGSWVAQDAGQELEFAMASLVKSLQIAQQPQKIAQGQQPAVSTNLQPIQSNLPGPGSQPAKP